MTKKTKKYKKSVDNYLKICYNVYRVKEREENNMEMNVWYFDDRNAVMDTIEEIKEKFPCFVTVKDIELDWIEVTIESRVEDTDAIDKMLARFAA